VVHLLALAATALVLPGFSHLTSGPAGGEVVTGTIPGTPRAACIYLPPHLERSRRYPVVYLLHGLPGSPNEYVFGTQIGQFADQGIAAGRLRPFIAVMPPAGTTAAYGGEWAGQWAKEVVDVVVPWVDSHLPAIDTAGGRVIAGLSAGGFGAMDITLRNPGLFGTAESWSGYFDPLRDGPFAHASAPELAANDPVLLARSEAADLRARGLRFFVSTGPVHSAQISPASSQAFAAELRRLGVKVAYRSYPELQGEWRDQLDAGLTWALGTG
jgi:enterochelin esterase-like enzyme